MVSLQCNLFLDEMIRGRGDFQRREMRVLASLPKILMKLCFSNI
jgi:hypothetical protein